jgi:hypothetical protein
LRWIALAAGLALVALAFAAATRVADTREGLIAEVVTLLAGLVGVSLLIYGWAARWRPAAPEPPRNDAAVTPAEPKRRTRRDLLLGAAGVAVGLVLLAGLAASGGPLWAALGLALLLPMLSGSVYLCVRYFRSEP